MLLLFSLLRPLHPSLHSHQARQRLGERPLRGLLLGTLVLFRLRLGLRLGLRLELVPGLALRLELSLLTGRLEAVLRTPVLLSWMLHGEPTRELKNQKKLLRPHLRRHPLVHKNRSRSQSQSQSQRLKRQQLHLLRHHRHRHRR